MFEITENAAKQIQEQARASQAEGMVLRLAAKANPDGSIHYGMGFDEQKEDDQLVDMYDVKIVIDPASVELLDEAKMDYVELEPGEFHFIFMNPLDPNYIPPKRQKKKTD